MCEFMHALCLLCEFLNNYYIICFCYKDKQIQKEELQIWTNLDQMELSRWSQEKVAMNIIE